MCLIIRTEQNNPISKPLLDHMQKRNGDGWGMMWLRNNHIRTFKSSTAEGLWEKYQELKEFEPIIHLRWKTHGEIDHENTHPHYCGHGIYLMHNGIVSTTIRDQAKSDTWHLAMDYLAPLFRQAINPHKMIRHPEFRKDFEQIIDWQRQIIGAENISEFYTEETGSHWYIYLKRVPMEFVNATDEDIKTYSGFTVQQLTQK